MLAPATRIVILAHRVELAKSTNTGRLVARMLGERAVLQLHDAEWQPELSSQGAYVLFPADDAQPLEHVADRIQTLIVPDGTWAQTRRLARKHPGCKDLPKVCLTDAPRSAYALRRARLHGGLCTLEAVAHALRVLEGNTCADTLMTVFASWVERALMVRAGAHAQPMPAPQF